MISLTPLFHSEPASAAIGSAQAASADAFVDSIGVNTHMHYGGTPYTENPGGVVEALEASGIRHYRDYASPYYKDTYLQFASKGIKMSAVMGAPGSDWWPISLEDTFQTAKAVHLAGGLDYFEGVNEPDINSYIDGGAGWAANARAFQQRIWNMVRSDPATASSGRVAGPGMTWADATGELGDISAWTDVTNMHPYPGGASTPESGRIAADQAAAWNNNARKPMVATETGYHTAVPTDTGHVGASERAQAIYTPRLFLESFDLGVERSYHYELVDSQDHGAEGRFGLLRGDLSPKPAYSSVQAMIALLNDKGPRFTPGSLAHSVVGADGDTRSVLLQKRDGTFWVAIWQATNVFDGANDRNPADRSVTLQLGQSASSVRSFSPNRGTQATAAASNTSSFNLTSSEEVTLVEVRGAGGSNIPAPTTTTTKPTTTTQAPTTTTQAPTATTQAPASTGTLVARINAGGGAVNESGMSWAADRNFTGGNIAVTAEPVSSSTPTVDSDERWDASGYAIPVPGAGTYTVKLHIVETAFESPGERMFDVTGESKVVAAGVDPFARAGARNVRTVLQVAVPVTDGTLNLAFNKIQDNPTLTGIEVYAPVGGAQAPTTTTAKPTTTTQAPTTTAKPTTTTTKPTTTTTQPRKPRKPQVGVVTAAGAGVIQDGQLVSVGDVAPGKNLVAVAETASGEGSWLVSDDGAVLALGDAGFYGSMEGTQLNRPIVGMAVTPSGRGYWMVASDGGIFTFGDASFYGSTGAIRLNQPIVAMAGTANGTGYWMVASDGGIFTFGDAAFLGSMGAVRLNQPVIGMAATESGRGYWLAASDGGIFTFGDAGFLGSTGDRTLDAPVSGMVPSPDGAGYSLVSTNGVVYSFG